MLKVALSQQVLRISLLKYGEEIQPSRFPLGTFQVQLVPEQEYKSVSQQIKILKDSANIFQV